MSAITTHVLDTAQGIPACGVPITLERLEGEANWRELASAFTDVDGRARTLLPAEEPLAPGVYRIRFDTETYFNSTGVEGFYPYVHIVFVVRECETHYHVPLLLSPFGYSTYRGS